MIPRAALLLIPFAAIAGQGTPEERVEALLARPAEMCGQFEQSKSLVGLRRPVKSSGRFCIAAGSGVLWSTLAPLPTRLHISPDEIVESQGDRETKRLSANQEPSVRIINDLLFSLVSGNLKRLAGSFVVAASITGDEWQARLEPRGAGIKQVIAGIDVTGGAFVKHVVIRDAGGDVTEIAFSNVVTGPGAFQPDEARRLGVRPPARTVPPPGHDD